MPPILTFVVEDLDDIEDSLKRLCIEIPPPGGAAAASSADNTTPSKRLTRSKTGQSPLTAAGAFGLDSSSGSLNSMFFPNRAAIAAGDRIGAEICDVYI